MSQFDASEDLKFSLMPMHQDDYPSVARIFTQGIQTGNATYDTVAASWADWDAKHLLHSRWVVKSEKDGSVLGWAALSPVSSRIVFTGVAELSIYVDTHFLGLGLGKALMTSVIGSSESHGMWMLQSGIFPENQSSIALHEKFGFRLVGRRERIGKMSNGDWRDIVLMERRSSVVG
jgi:phosphinothricin acetyltransferase